MLTMHIPKFGVLVCGIYIHTGYRENNSLIMYINLHNSGEKAELC